MKRIIFFLSIFPTILLASQPRDLSILEIPAAFEIGIKEKQFNGQSDFVFVDGLGREATFRGWNISHISKSPRFGFLPVPLEHRQVYLDDYKRRSGANIARWLINWEAIHPEVDQINEEYLRNLVAFLKEAARRKIYIILDFHQDIFSRWISTKNSPLPISAVDGWDQDGAPKFIIDGMKLPKGSCGKICIIWSQNYFTNSAIKAAFRNFWNNIEIETKKGPRKVQDEFLWQMEKALTYIKNNLTPAEFNFILGVEPMNEPSEGGLRAYNPPLTPNEWFNQKAWPFYLRVRESMNQVGYQNKPVFPEPSSYWMIGLSFISARGQITLKNPPAKGFVFSAHKYDERRETFSPITPLINNGAYLDEMEIFRLQGRHFRGPSIITEYGGWGKKRSNDGNRMLKARYQGMELSRPINKAFRSPNFYSPIVHGTMWVWESFNYETFQPKEHLGEIKGLWERSYPRRVQGDLMHFYYNDNVKDNYKGRDLIWMGLSVGKNIFFEKNKYSFMAWRGRNSDAPSEIYLPRHINLDKLLLITETEIIYGNEIAKVPKGSFNALTLPDIDPSGGSSLFIFEDFESGEGPDTMHFALAVETEKMDPVILKKIQEEISKQVARKISPLRFLGDFKIDKPRKGKPNKIPFLLEGK